MTYRRIGYKFFSIPYPLVMASLLFILIILTNHFQLNINNLINIKEN